MRLAQTAVGVAVAAEIGTRPALVTGSSTHRSEEGRAYTVLVEQGAQIDEDLLGQTFDIDREVKTHGSGPRPIGHWQSAAILGSRGSVKGASRRLRPG
jgi:hypothetical protein